MYIIFVPTYHIIVLSIFLNCTIKDLSSQNIRSRFHCNLRRTLPSGLQLVEMQFWAICLFAWISRVRSRIVLITGYEFSNIIHLFNLKIRAGLLKCVFQWNCYKYSVSAIEKNTWNNNAVAINWLQAARECCWLLCARRERTRRGWNLCTACVVNESVQMVMLHFCWIKNAK